MPDSPTSSDFVGLHRSATVIGHLAWVERRVFEMLGGWVQGVPELPVKLALAQQSYHHAWHEELLLDRLPVVVDLVPSELRRPATPGVEDLLELVGAPTATDQTIEKLAGLYRVLIPAKLAAYEAWLAGSSPVADAPLRRALGFVLIDERADQLEGEELLTDLLPDEASRERARSWTRKVQDVADAAGPLGGDGGF